MTLPEGTGVVVPTSTTQFCPDWCVVRHGVMSGEEDWVHVGPRVPVQHRSTARLCMTADPFTGRIDGPFVLVEATEYTLTAAEELGGDLAILARQARSGVRPR